MKIETIIEYEIDLINRPVIRNSKKFGKITAGLKQKRMEVNQMIVTLKRTQRLNSCFAK